MLDAPAVDEVSFLVRSGNNLKRFKDFYLKAKAIICSRQSYMWHILYVARTTVVHAAHICGRSTNLVEELLLGQHLGPVLEPRVHHAYMWDTGVPCSQETAPLPQGRHRALGIFLV